MKSVKFLLSIAGALLTASGALASNDTITRTLQEYEVVSARVRDDVTSSAPLFSISDEKMKTMGVTDISDALHRLPGINLRDYGGAGGLKTVSVRGLGSTHTGVIYDGAVLSDCQRGQIDLSRYSLNNVGNLSLIVGDNNDIFIPAKAAASAASVIISTLSVPSAKDSLWHFTGQMRFGSWGTYNPYFRLGKTITRHFSFSAIGEFTHAKNNYPFTLKNGIETTRERRGNSRMNTGHVELNTAWRPTDASSLDAKLYYYDNARQLPGPVVLYNPISNEKMRERNAFGQLSYKNTSLTKFSFQGLAKFNWDFSHYEDHNGKYPGGVWNERYYQREVYLSGAALYTATEKLSFSYAADYAYNNLTTDQVSVVGPWRHTLLQSVAGKFKTKWMVATARLLCSVYKNGVKSGESAGNYSRLSPSLSLSFRPISGRQFYLRTSYKNIFRMPTFNESYYFMIGSAALKPETTDQINLGATWQYQSNNLLETLILTGDLYYNKVKDKIVAMPMNMFLWTMRNIAKARTIGADATLDTEIRIAGSHSLLVAGNYSLQRVQSRVRINPTEYNKQIAYTPVHSGAASICWKNPWVDVAVHTTAQSERYATNNNLPTTRLKGFADCGLSLMRSFSFCKHNAVDLRLDITNIFDSQYEIVSAYPMPGRGWAVTATYTYN